MLVVFNIKLDHKQVNLSSTSFSKIASKIRWRGVVFKIQLIEAIRQNPPEM